MVKRYRCKRAGDGSSDNPFRAAIFDAYNGGTIAMGFHRVVSEGTSFDVDVLTNDLDHVVIQGISSVQLLE